MITNKKDVAVKIEEPVPEPMITVADLRNLKHALGSDVRHAKKDWGFRCYFAPAKCDIESMHRLVDAGLMVRVEGNVDDVYFATPLGAEVVGCSKKVVKAMRRLFSTPK